MNTARAIIPNLTPEEEFILCCARTELQPTHRARLKELAASALDWKRIDEIARLHRLRPLLFKHLKAEALINKLPPEIWAAIQFRALKMTAHNMAQINALKNLLAQFRAAGIEAVPFKGPVLALRNYGNIGLREFFDMDLLLRKPDILKAKKILVDQGYTSPWKQNDQWEQQHIDAQLGCDFLSADSRIRLELHWSFLQKWLSYDIDLDTLWTRLENWDFAGQPIRIVNRNDLLIYLCAHGAKHHWERLFWIIDIAEILRAEKNLDWNTLLTQSRAQGSFRVLALGLHLAHNLLDAPLPEIVLRQIQRDPKVPILAAQIGSWLFNEPNRLIHGTRAETQFFLSVKERLTDRLAFYRHMLRLALEPSEKDRAFIKLPKPLDFLYPAVRPIRFVCGFLRN